MPIEGVIILLVKAFTLPQRVTIQLDCLVVMILVAYNTILKQPGLCALNDVVSVKHLLVKFLMRNGIGQIKESQTMARQCYNTKIQAEA